MVLLTLTGLAALYWVLLSFTVSWSLQFAGPALPDGATDNRGSVLLSVAVAHFVGVSIAALPIAIAIDRLWRRQTFLYGAAVALPLTLMMIAEAVQGGFFESSDAVLQWIFLKDLVVVLLMIPVLSTGIGALTSNKKSH
jgi:hypothetical protein